MEKQTRKLLKILMADSPVSIRQALKKWCGKKLASGRNRDVYECKFDPNWVVKIQVTNNFDNVIEWNIWCAISLADWWAKWFAECLCISESGMVMVQRRVEFPARKTYPKKVPRFFTDLKYQNYGFVDGQLKAVDYSNVLSMMTGFLDKKMRLAKWWSPYNSRKHIKKGRNRKTVLSPVF